MCAHCQYTHKNWHDATHSKNTWWGSITCPPPTPPLNSCVALHVTLALSDPQFPDLLSPSFSNHCLSLTKFFQCLSWDFQPPSLCSCWSLSPSPLHLAGTHTSLKSCPKCLSWGRCLWLLDELTSHWPCVSEAPCLSPIMTQVSIIQLSVYPLAQRSLIFLVPGTSFMEDHFSMD